MATKLGIYNQALIELKVSTIDTLGAGGVGRLTFDQLWDDVIQGCLESGYWKFAMRTVQIDVDPDVTPAFAYANAFNFPSDWVKTYLVSLNEYMDPPLVNGAYLEEANLLFCDAEPLFLRFVSNSTAGYGGDLLRWTEKFGRYVALELAWRGCPKVAGSSEGLREAVEENRDKARSQALAFEAHREPPKRPPEGNYNGARFRGRGNATRGDGGWYF